MTTRSFDGRLWWKRARRHCRARAAFAPGETRRFIGVDDDRAANIALIRRLRPQKRVLPQALPVPPSISLPIEGVSGATIFVLSVDRFQKV